MTESVKEDDKGRGRAKRLERLGNSGSISVAGRAWRNEVVSEVMWNGCGMGK